MRSILLVILLPLAACGGGTGTLSIQPPSLRVGEAALEGGVPQAALSIAQRRLAIDRDDVAALLIQGKALDEMGETEKAVASFRHAAKLAPASADAHFGIGRSLLAAGQPEEAEAAFRRALEITQDDARALTDLGVSLDLQGKHGDAQAAYGRALVASPELDAARVNLGLSLALSGDPDKAVEILRPLGGGPDAPRRARHDLATALAIDGDKAGAERLLRPDLTAEQVSTAMAAYAALQEPVPDANRRGF